jgi:hypothetical protein
LSWNWTKKWIYYLAYTNVANKNCVKFCMKEVFKCRERRMMRWDEVWTKAQPWGFPCHPKKYPISTSVKAWGCPEPPLLHRQISGHLSRHYIFIASYSMRFYWASLFLLSVFFCFVCCNKWLDPNIFLLEKTYSVFHCQEHSSFHFYRSTSVLFL